MHLRTTCQTDIECYLKIYDPPPKNEPYLGFEQPHVRRVAELGASLGIDYYDFRSTGVEPD